MSRLLLPLCGFLLIVLQTVISDLLFFGRFAVDISIILVIYGAFHLPLVKGAMTAFVLGFFLDSFMGSVSGLFAFSYMSIFLISRFVSLRFYAERFSFIAVYVGVCVLLEAVLIIAIYKLAYGVDKSFHLVDVFLPQALVAGLIGPVLFQLFRRIEALADGNNTHPVEQ